FGLHDLQNLPWNLHVVGHQLSIQAITCREIIVSSSELKENHCSECHKLLTHSVFLGILDRINEGVHENTPLAYQPIGGLTAVIHRKTKQLDALRFTHLNASQKLLSRARSLDDYKKFVMALGDSRGTRLDTLIR
ncbi:hypothetical protein BD779DRAFT_1398357, partial [Infundibulicybe gibba]